MLRNDRSNRVMMKAAETMTSTDLCGPRFLRYDRTDNHVFMFRTLLSRKCGRSDLRVRRDEVK